MFIFGLVATIAATAAAAVAAELNECEAVDTLQVFVIHCFDS